MYLPLEHRLTRVFLLKKRIIYRCKHYRKQKLFSTAQRKLIQKIREKLFENFQKSEKGTSVHEMLRLYERWVNICLERVKTKKYAIIQEERRGSLMDCKLRLLRHQMYEKFNAHALGMYFKRLCKICTNGNFRVPNNEQSFTNALVEIENNLQNLTKLIVQIKKKMLTINYTTKSHQKVPTQFKFDFYLQAEEEQQKKFNIAARPTKNLFVTQLSKQNQKFQAKSSLNFENFKKKIKIKNKNNNEDVSGQQKNSRIRAETVKQNRQKKHARSKKESTRTSSKVPLISNYTAVKDKPIFDILDSNDLKRRRQNTAIKKTAPAKNKKVPKNQKFKSQKPLATHSPTRQKKQILVCIDNKLYKIEQEIDNILESELDMNALITNNHMHKELCDVSAKIILDKKKKRNKKKPLKRKVSYQHRFKKLGNNFHSKNEVTLSEITNQSITESTMLKSNEVNKTPKKKCTITPNIYKTGPQMKELSDSPTCFKKHMIICQDNSLYKIEQETNIKSESDININAIFCNENIVKESHEEDIIAEKDAEELKKSVPNITLKINISEVLNQDYADIESSYAECAETKLSNTALKTELDLGQDESHLEIAIISDKSNLELEEKYKEETFVSYTHTFKHSEQEDSVKPEEQLAKPGEALEKSKSLFLHLLCNHTSREESDLTSNVQNIKSNYSKNKIEKIMQSWTHHFEGSNKTDEKKCEKVEKFDDNADNTKVNRITTRPVNRLYYEPRLTCRMKRVLEEDEELDTVEPFRRRKTWQRGSKKKHCPRCGISVEVHIKPRRACSSTQN